MYHLDAVITRRLACTNSMTDVWEVEGEMPSERICSFINIQGRLKLIDQSVHEANPHRRLSAFLGILWKPYTIIHILKEPLITTFPQVNVDLSVFLIIGKCIFKRVGDQFVEDQTKRKERVDHDKPEGCVLHALQQV